MQISLPPKGLNAPNDLTDPVDEEVLPESVDDNLLCVLAGEQIGEDGDIDNGDADGTFLCCCAWCPGELTLPALALFECDPCPEDLFPCSSEEGENMVGDKIPESIEKLDGEFGT